MGIAIDKRVQLPKSATSYISNARYESALSTTVAGVTGPSKPSRIRFQFSQKVKDFKFASRTDVRLYFYLWRRRADLQNQGH